MSVKRKISTSGGIIEVDQIGNLNKIGDQYYFKANYQGVKISELSTGFAMPRCGTFKEVENFLNKQPEGRINQVMSSAKKQMEDLEIQFPLNERED